MSERVLKVSRVAGDKTEVITTTKPSLLHVEELFSGRQEVRLSYEGQEYRLRITRNRKLILTK